VTSTTAGRRRRAALAPDHQLLSRSAHWHADQGWYVFPLVPGRKIPAVHSNWEHQATIDHHTIAATWRRARYNIGLATGPSGLLVVDLDQPKHPDDLPPEPWRNRGAANGADVLALVAADHNAALRPTYTVTTPSGGQHLYYKASECELGNSAGRIGWKIDTRGHGGYVIGAGSITPAGRYQATNTTPPRPLPSWVSQTLDTTCPETTAPATTSRNLRNASTYALAALTGELDNVLTAQPGQRNHTLNRAAFALGQLTGAQLLDGQTARDELLSAAGRIGLPRREAERTITSGLTAGARQPRRQPN
jgi:hypothetical protein